jgi:hypothetical protein
MFNELLGEYGIHHVYTTPYNPSSNGLVERVNRTLAELLRNLSATHSTWDDYIPRAVVLYNSSYHSELKMSPSSYLLTKPFDLDPSTPLAESETQYWREGNPAFSPFEKGHLVLRKTVWKGRNVADKLADRYTGPYEIVSRRRNRVTYIIRKCSDGTEQRAHHTQLRRYHNPPKYITSHTAYKRLTQVEGTETEDGDGEERKDPDEAPHGDIYSLLVGRTPIMISTAPRKMRSSKAQ